MTIQQFMTQHKKELWWGAIFGLVTVFIGDALVKILEFIEMIADYIFMAIIWIIQLPPKVTGILNFSENQFILIITSIVVGALLGIVIYPAWQWLWKLLGRSPV